MKLRNAFLFYGMAIFLVLSLLTAGFSLPGNAQTPSRDQITSVSPTTQTGNEITEEVGMTLFDLLSAGGWIMVVLAILSILALSLAIYYMITLTEKKIVPNDIVTQIRHYIRDGRYDDVARICRRSKGMFCKVIHAGLSRGLTDPASVASTMEAVGRREAERLMRQVRYLSDIAQVAPMLGLLGTVLGMINAFNFIAFDISAVKPVALASAVAQALVTTAAGLIVAIPCMGFFFFFRGRLQTLIGKVEEVAVEAADRLSSMDRG
jgi:biopolymer transport protein ExbB